MTDEAKNKKPRWVAGLDIGIFFKERPVEGSVLHNQYSIVEGLLQ
jgi:hypothetical protein